MIVDAVVVDKAGKPVTNLTAADFEVRDEGRARADLAVPDRRGRRGDGTDRRPRCRAPLRLQHQHRPARPGRAFVLFFDDVHLTQAEGDRAKVALNQFLERELQPGDLVSLVAPGRRCAGTRGCLTGGPS